MLLVLIAVTIIVFAMSRVQGDPRLLYLNDSTTEEQWDTWGREMGLDQPVVVRYLVWFGKAIRGDLGTSLREARPVTTAVLERLPATLELGLASWVFAIAVGWPLAFSQRSSVRRYGTTSAGDSPSSGRRCRLLGRHHAGSDILRQTRMASYRPAWRSRPLHPAIHRPWLDRCLGATPPGSIGDAGSVGLRICQAGPSERSQQQPRHLEACASQRTESRRSHLRDWS